MNDIISKLSDIEQNAAAIMDDANARKKAIAQDMAEQTAAFDTELEADTARKLSDLRAALDADMHTKLSKQQQEAQEVLKRMDSDYQSNHAIYVSQLFEAVTKG